MNAVLQYQNHWDEWLRQQAAMLREGRFNEVDRIAIAEELEGIVQSDEQALVSYLKQVMIHLCKLRYLKNRQPVRHWQAELTNFRGEIGEKFQNAYSNPARQAAMQMRAWKTARKVLQHVLDPTDAKSLPHECPFSLEQLRDDDYFG